MKSAIVRRKWLSFMFIVSMLGSVLAKENVPGNTPITGGNSGGGDGQKLSNSSKVMSGCLQGTKQTEIKLNNVRTRILTCGDMWWDVNSNPKYEVPKGSGSYASFAGSLWFGGYINGTLRTSAMTYRQSGVDFWPGPLDPVSQDIDAATCNAYDKHWRFIRADVDEFYNKYAGSFYPATGITIDPSYSVPNWIKEFPGNAPSAADPYYYLAPFVDGNTNNTYDWQSGDYPAYNVKNVQIAQGNCKKLLFGDETLFWVFNDKGNSHTETGTVGAIGVEIRAQGFEFATSDVLNDMTFYNFEIINRSNNVLDCTYFAVWVDADLGNYIDDYVGCDVGRGLGYIYNGDNYDDDNQGVIGYHSKLPALGCDFFQGPDADLNDNLDNDRDGCIDCTWQIDVNTGLPDMTLPPYTDTVLREHISMAKFVPYSNDNDALTGNPSGGGNGKQYYNYMSGRWRNGAYMKYDGLKGTSVTGTTCSYLFPGTSDPLGYGVGGGPGNPQPQPNWTEVTAANVKGDRRFLQSAGIFTLQPGAINTITFGMPFVRTNSDNNFAAIPLLLIADDKAQSLFDNCFKVLDGPDAPDMTIQEMENQLIFYFSNKITSNNYEQNRYADIDPTITPIFGGNTDKTYRFEGYMVFQLKDESVSAGDLYDESKSRLVFQCDKKNGVSTLINYNSDPTLGTVPQLMTPSASDKGIINSFSITEDMFAEGVKTLVNHKTYYYMSIAYAYNNYLTYKQDVAPGTDTSGNDVHPTDGDFAGQKKPYLQGRRNVKVYSAIPHNITPEANGTVINSAFGFGPKVTRLEGQGNGGRAVDLTESTINSILSSPISRAVNLEYENNAGPIGVKVIDPLKVLSGNFIVKLKKVMTDVNGKDSLVYPDKSDLDSGKVKSTYKYEIAGNYTSSSGASVSKTWASDEIIDLGQEFILIGDDKEPIGISVTVSQDIDPVRAAVYLPGSPYATNSGSSQKADLLSSSLTFSDPNQKWLTGVVDQETPTEDNWIRSGITSATNGYDDNQIKITGAGGKVATYYADPDQTWENVVGGTWAPYRMVAQGNPSTAALPMAPGFFGFVSTGTGPGLLKYTNKELDTRDLASVDIVFTSDKSKWTRCVVLEMGTANAVNNANIGDQRKFLPRKSPSVNRNGDTVAIGTGPSTNPNDPNYISDWGMGWFPGYAINVETGERLNIAFGENSQKPTENGADMFWNPTSTQYLSNGTPSFGGQHYIYVFGHNSDGGVGTANPIDVPRYDAGATLFTMLNKTMTGTGNNSPTNGYGQASIVEAFKDAMWVNIPLISSAYTGNFTRNHQPSIPCDAKVKIRVRKPLRWGLSGNWAKAYSTAVSGTSASTYNPGTTYLNSTAIANLTDDTIQGSQNNNFPMYGFNTAGLGASTNMADAAKSALDLINIVPNPYYGHSKYEKTRLDNYVKIVNLPVKCTIRIYNVNGTLIRTIKKNTDATTDVQWDLKNEINILIASGLYVVHIDAGDLGEKVLKWFCVMRPIDLQSY